MLTRCNNCFKEYDDDLGLCPFCGYSVGEAPSEVFCLTPGTVIADRYIIGEMLGLGGFGITYKAWDKKLNTLLAIKEYYPSGLVNRQPGETNVMLVATKREREFVYGKTRFLEEARNMAKFSTHKNIVNVFDFFEANNTAYIVMEFLDGRTLSQVLQQQNVPLPYDHCITIATQVSTALKAIHKENILHRDVSPDNIMICNNGTVKLFDFGAARFSAGVENRVTVVVKPGFAPPEQYDKVNRQDARTDIYALGATLYYAMTGVKPEESTNRKIEDTLSTPSTIDKNIPENISNAIMRAMAIEPQYRFSTVDDFESALAGGKKVTSVQKERAKRKKRQVAGILASFIVIVGAAALFLYMLKGQRDSATLPDASLDIWYIQTGVEDTDTAKALALDNIAKSFTDQYSNVELKLTPIEREKYEAALASAATSGQFPAIFESTDITSNLAITLPNEIFFSRGEGFIVSTRGADESKFNTGLIVPIIYINSIVGTPVSLNSLEEIQSYCQEKDAPLVIDKSARDLYTQLFIGEDINPYMTDTASEDFTNRTAAVFLGSSLNYFEIQRELPGEYSIMVPNCEDMIYQYGTQWSISDVNDDELKVAEEFLSYLTTPLAQDYLYLQNQSGELPIIKDSMDKYIEIYGELAPFQKYFASQMAVAPAYRPNSESSDVSSESTSVAIPQTIVNIALYNMEETPEEYQPKITFYEDMHCDLVLNMAEWMQTIPATYKVFAYSDGSKVIKCNLGNADIGDGLQRNLRDFILVQTSENEWTFYGQSMGLIFTDTIYTAAGTGTIEIRPEKNDTFSFNPGEYLPDDDSGSFTLVSHEGKSIKFGVDWYRWTGMANVTASLYGNYAVFDYSTEDGYEETKGYVEFLDAETVVLTLTESKLPYMEPSTYTYQYVPEEVLKANEISWTKSMLLLNDDNWGWYKEGHDDSGARFEDALIRFFEDGSLKYWIGTSNGGEVTYIEHDATYSVDTGTIYINDCAYEAFVEETAMPHLYLEAKDIDTLHLNGAYICEGNETYQFLVKN